VEGLFEEAGGGQENPTAACDQESEKKHPTKWVESARSTLNETKFPEQAKQDVTGRASSERDQADFENAVQLRRAFYADYGDFVEAFFEDGGLELFAHFAHDVFAYASVALGIALEANFKWNIKEDGLDFVSKAFSHLDPLATLVDGEVGGVDVVPGHAGDEAGAEQGAEGGKDEALVALFFDVVEEDVAEQVAGERGDSAAAEPGGLAGAGEADCEHYVALWSLRRAAGGLGLSRRRAGRLWLGFEFKAAGADGLVPIHSCGAFGTGVAFLRRGPLRGRLGALDGGLGAFGWGLCGSGLLGGLGAGPLVAVERDKRSELIGGQFLADFACGLRGIGCASGTSSH